MLYQKVYVLGMKGAYYFATVGRSVCRPSVVRSISLLTPSLDQYQTWCRGCPQCVDDPSWFSGHLFKSQGQTTLLSPLCCPVNIFWPLHLINTKTWCRGCPQWVDDPYWFSDHMFKGQGQTTLLSTFYIFITCLLASDRFCSYREDKPEFCTMGGIDVS